MTALVGTTGINWQLHVVDIMLNASEPVTKDQTLYSSIHEVFKEITIKGWENQKVIAKDLGKNIYLNMIKSILQDGKS